MDYKTRANNSPFEITSNRRLNFYAAIFGETTTITEPDADGKLVTYQERIMPGAFAQALASDADVTANLDHSDQFLFARRSDGTLLLQEDPHGLFASAWVPEGELGDRILERVKSGELDGCSFRFAPLSSRTVGGVVERVAVQLRDVCLTSHPAYPETHVELMRRQDRTRSLLTRYRLLKIAST